MIQISILNDLNLNIEKLKSQYQTIQSSISNGLILNIELFNLQY